MLKEKMLLGATKEGTLVFANIEIRGDERIFSVSFNEVRPFIASDTYLKERLEGIFDDYDCDYKLRLLQDYDCKYSELLDEHYSQIMRYDGVEGIMDISLYPESFQVSDIDDDIYFDSVSCGQGDYREQLIPINHIFTECVFILWDKYHLNNICKEKYIAIEKAIKEYTSSFNEEEWVKNWLEENKWEL